MLLFLSKGSDRAKPEKPGAAKYQLMLELTVRYFSVSHQEHFS